MHAVVDGGRRRRDRVGRAPAARCPHPARRRQARGRERRPRAGSHTSSRPRWRLLRRGAARWRGVSRRARRAAPARPSPPRSTLVLLGGRGGGAKVVEGRSATAPSKPVACRTCSAPAASATGRSVPISISIRTSAGSSPGNASAGRSSSRLLSTSTSMSPVWSSCSTNTRTGSSGPMPLEGSQPAGFAPGASSASIMVSGGRARRAKKRRETCDQQASDP